MSNFENQLPIPRSIPDTKANEILSINLCAKNIINQMDYIVELGNTDIDKDLKYSLVAEVVESMKKSCDSILKCLGVELQKGDQCE